MKLYAIQDLVLEYFLAPFAAADDNQAMGGLATLVNTENSDDPVSKSPQDFVLWQVATCDDQGNINADKRKLRNAATLIRRTRTTEGAGSGHEIPPTARQGNGHATGAPGGGHANKRPPPGTLAPEEGKA